MLNGWDVLMIVLGFFLVERLLEKILLFITTKAAIKQAGVIGSTKEEILKQTTEIVTTVTEEAKRIILANVETKIKDEVIKIVDAENKNVVLALTKDKSKKK